MDNNDDTNLVDFSEKPITETTCLLPELLANSEKLVDEKKRTYFEKPEKKEPDDDHYGLDDDADNYVPQNNGNQKTFTDYKHDDYQEPNHTDDHHHSHQDPIYSKDEEMHIKLDLLRKLGELKKNYGIKLSQNYNMNSDIKVMEYEYNLHRDIKDKQNAVDLMSQLLLLIVQGAEWANEAYDPFNVSVRGWKEQVNSSISSYYDVLGEIYEKYHQPGKKMAPELKLIFMLLGAAATVQITKLAPQLPGGGILNSNLINMLRKKASNEPEANVFDKEHEDAVQRAKDMVYIQEKKKEYEIAHSQKQNAESLLGKLALSSESHDEVARLQQIQLDQANKKCDQLESNLDKMAEIKQKQKRLEDIMKRMGDDESSSYTAKSVVSVNPKLDEILAKVATPKKDEISFDDISLGTNKSKNKPKPKPKKSKPTINIIH